MYSLLQLVHRNLLLPAFVVPMLCCPLSDPHLGHSLFSLSMGVIISHHGLLGHSQSAACASEYSGKELLCVLNAAAPGDFTVENESMENIFRNLYGLQDAQ